jgi:small subunit ribosomal protein S1
MSAENAPESPKPETPAPTVASQPPKPGAPRVGGKPIPDKWQRGGPPKKDKPAIENFGPRQFGEFKPNKRALDADIEAEMNAAFAGTDLAAMDADKPQGPKSEDGRFQGQVVSIRGKDVFVDIPGRRSQGRMSIDEFEDAKPKVGDTVEVLIERYDSDDGLLVLTREGAVKQVTDWSSISFGMIVEAKITGMNKNQTGYQIEVNGIRGFMPLSQADLYRIEKPESLVNSKLKVQVVELDPQERNLIVSHRAIQEAERQKKAAAFWETIAEGQVHKGIVRSIKPFGAFVDLGGADGLIPIGELSWSRVGTVEEVLKIGQEVEVKIARLDPEARKIGLSLRALSTSPWESFAAEHRPGLRVPGRVTRLMDFGAFVEIAPGIEGLIHVSELAPGRVNRVRDILSEGQEVTVQILNIDTEARRIALSLKAMTAEAEAASAAQAEAEAKAEAEADQAAAAERLANRKPTGNLRGGVGGGTVRFEIG